MDYRQLALEAAGLAEDWQRRIGKLEADARVKASRDEDHEPVVLVRIQSDLDSNIWYKYCASKLASARQKAALYSNLAIMEKLYEKPPDNVVEINSRRQMTA